MFEGACAWVCVASPYGDVCRAQVSSELGCGGRGGLPVPIVCPQSLQRARAASNMANECMSEYKDE